MLMFKKEITIIFLVSVFSFPILELNAQALPYLPNPAAEHCEKSGYEYVVVDTPEGQVGECQLNTEEQVSAWDFYEGKTNLDDNYCAQQGLESKVENAKVVCVKEDGVETEMAELISKSRPIPPPPVCQIDGKCQGQEDEQNCPDDCWLNKELPTPVMVEQDQELNVCTSDNCIKDDKNDNLKNKNVIINKTGNLDLVKISIYAFIAILFVLALVLVVLFKEKAKKEEKDEKTE